MIIHGQYINPTVCATILIALTCALIGRTSWWKARKDKPMSAPMGLAFASALLITAWYLDEGEIRAKAEPAPSAPASAPSPPILPPPPCIHEVCSERPAELRCVELREAARYLSPCIRFEIQYARHCDCDTWGPRP